MLAPQSGHDLALFAAIGPEVDVFAEVFITSQCAIAARQPRRPNWRDETQTCAKNDKYAHKHKLIVVSENFLQAV